MLVAQKFSVESSLVIALALQLLPRVVFAPLIAKVMLKKGAKNVAGIAILGCAIVHVILLYVDSHMLFQFLMLLSGLLDTAIIAAMLVMRSQIATAGRNTTINAIFSTTERVSKIIGSALAGVLLWKLPILHGVYVVALSFVVASILLFKSPIRPKRASLVQQISYQAFLRLFKEQPILWALVVPGLSYALLLGTLPLFLYWANTEILHKPESQWTLLLTFHGVGAVLGGVLSSKVLYLIQKKTSLVRAYPWIVLVRALCFLSLISVCRWELALMVLVVVGLPEMLEIVCFFTLLQKYLPSHQEELFYAFMMPMFYACTVLGSVLGGMYTQHLISLREFWLLTSTLCLITILPFLPYIKATKRI